MEEIEGGVSIFAPRVRGAVARRHIVFAAPVAEQEAEAAPEPP